jgi:hypothetical protein
MDIGTIKNNKNDIGCFLIKAQKKENKDLGN